MLYKNFTSKPIKIIFFDDWLTTLVNVVLLNKNNKSMKKLLTIVSALLIITGVKAQKTSVQKETVKPIPDTLVKNKANQQLKNTIIQKDAKVAPVYKYAPASKLTPATTKASKVTSIHQ